MNVLEAIHTWRSIAQLRKAVVWSFLFVTIYWSANSPAQASIKTTKSKTKKATLKKATPKKATAKKATPKNTIKEKAPQQPVSTPLPYKERHIKSVKSYESVEQIPLEGNPPKFSVLAPGRRVVAVSEKGSEAMMSLLVHEAVTVGDGIPTPTYKESNVVFSFQYDCYTGENERIPTYIGNTHLSPNGRYVALFFTMLDGRDVDNSALFVLDIEKKILKSVGKAMSIARAWWSPDSRYLAYVYGGNSTGSAWRSAFNTEDYLGPLELTIYDWQTGKERLVATNEIGFYDIEWQPPHDLLVAWQPDGNRSPEIMRYNFEQGTIRKTEKSNGETP